MHFKDNTDWILSIKLSHTGVQNMLRSQGRACHARTYKLTKCLQDEMTCVASFTEQFLSGSELG